MLYVFKPTEILKLCYMIDNSQIQIIVRFLLFDFNGFWQKKWRHQTNSKIEFFTLSLNYRMISKEYVEVNSEKKNVI